MDAGINGDFEYLINESSPGFEALLPTRFHPSRVFLSFLFFIFIFILFSSFYLSFFPFFFFLANFRTMPGLMKFRKGGEEFWRRARAIEGAVWQLSRFVK